VIPWNHDVILWNRDVILWNHAVILVFAARFRDFSWLLTMAVCLARIFPEVSASVSPRNGHIESRYSGSDKVLGGGGLHQIW
jgi:hypothetical protein